MLARLLSHPLCPVMSRHRAVAVLSLSLVAFLMVWPVPVAAQEPPDAALRLPPEVRTDCTGDIPIVVGSDAGAQSDIYAAVTLAGVIGTDCIVLAGARNRPMPAGHQLRLEAAEPGGWIVGGRAAVPAYKTAGRAMTRLAGVDRWHTARLVGAVAADPYGDIDELTARTAPTPTNPADEPEEPPVTASYSCYEEHGDFNTISSSGLEATNEFPGGGVRRGLIDEDVECQILVHNTTRDRIRVVLQVRLLDEQGNDAPDLSYDQIDGGVLISVGSRPNIRISAGTSDDTSWRAWGSHLTVTCRWWSDTDTVRFPGNGLTELCPVTGSGTVQ